MCYYYELCENKHRKVFVLVYKIKQIYHKKRKSVNL